MLATKYWKNRYGSTSGASTLYQATGLPISWAKSVARVLFPEPARPLIIVEKQVMRLSASNRCNRGRTTVSDRGGSLIFSAINGMALGECLVSSITSISFKRGPCRVWCRPPASSEWSDCRGLHGLVLSDRG